MRTIGNLVDHVERLKNKHIHSTLREIVPECVPSEKNVQKNDKQEDEDDVKVENWSMGRRNRRSGNKRDSEESENVRNTHEFLESDIEE